MSGMDMLEALGGMDEQYVEEGRRLEELYRETGKKTRMRFQCFFWKQARRGLPAACAVLLVCAMLFGVVFLSRGGAGGQAHTFGSREGSSGGIGEAFEGIVGGMGSGSQNAKVDNESSSAPSSAAPSSGEDVFDAVKDYWLIQAAGKLYICPEGTEGYVPDMDTGALTELGVVTAQVKKGAPLDGELASNCLPVGTKVYRIDEDTILAAEPEMGVQYVFGDAGKWLEEYRRN